MVRKYQGQTPDAASRFCKAGKRFCQIFWHDTQVFSQAVKARP
jgi:hypothetical protein